LASFVLVLGLVVDVQAANVDWTGAGLDDLWSTPENWSTGALPTAADRFRMINEPGGATIVTVGVVALDGWVGAPVGDGQTAHLTIDGGTLTTSSFIVVGRRNNDNGTLNVVNGAVTVGNTLYIGHTGTGVLEMTGGTVTAPAAITIGLNATSVGHVNLDGGIINAGNLNMSVQPGAVGTMDVKAGTLILNGDLRERVQGFIDNGWITFYQGQGAQVLDYDAATDRTTLAAIHNFNPSPVDGGAVGPGAVELSWTVDEGIPVDVWLGTSPGLVGAELIVTKGSVTSVIVQAQPKTTYYWAVDTYIGDPNDPIFGSIFSFYADNLPPEVDAGTNAVTWLVDGVMTKNLDATVTDDEAYTVQWTVASEPDDPNSPDAVIADPSAEDTSITLSAYGEYVLQLEASDGEYAGSDTVTINVYHDGCEAAKALPDYVPFPGDLNGDCKVDELDLAILEEDWLKDNSLTEP